MPKLKGDPGLPHLPACCQTGRRTLDSQQTPGLRNSHDRCAATCSNSVGSPSLHVFAQLHRRLLTVFGGAQGLVLVEKVLISSYYFRWNFRITHCISYRALLSFVYPLQIT